MIRRHGPARRPEEPATPASPAQRSAARRIPGAERSASSPPAQRPRRFGGDQGLGGIPVHEWQIVISGIPGMTDQGCDDIPALFQRQALRVPKPGKDEPSAMGRCVQAAANFARIGAGGGPCSVAS